MIQNFDVREEYIGTGNQAIYAFGFTITDPSQIVILVTDNNFNLIFRTNGYDTVNLASFTFNALNGGGLITLASNLPNNYNLTLLLANDQPVQQTMYRNKGDFNLRTIESSLDYLTSAVQRLQYLVQRSFKLGDNITNEEPFNTSLPANSTNPAIQNNENCVLAIGPDNQSFIIGPSITSLANQAAAAAVSATSAAASASASAASAASAATSATSATASAASAAASAAAAQATVFPETEQAIQNNESVATNIANLTLNSANFSAGKVYYEIYRYNGTTERLETGWFTLQYLPVAGTWSIGQRQASYDALNNGAGSLSVTTSAGIAQVKYTSDNFAGQTVGKFRWKFIAVMGVL